MAIRNILKKDEPRLLKVSRTVTDFDHRLHQLLDDMHETLVDANGLGLAAPQVGVLRRAVLIVDINYDADPPEETTIELINPEIISREGEIDSTEGCLSVPGMYGFVCRPEKVTVKAQDRFGKTFEVECKDMTARAACHEIDHLNGILFTSLTDHLLTDEELEKLQAQRRQKEAEV